MRKLSINEKRYRRTVIFDNEIKMLQEKINALDLSSPLTIKKLTFDYNASQKHRMLCLTFKETFTVIHRYNDSKRKEKVNKWASVHMVFDGSGIKHNGLVITEAFCFGGAIYKDNDNHIDDEDIRKVCCMLANEYFLWIHWTDYHVKEFINFTKCRTEANNDSSPINYRPSKYFLNVMWKRMCIAFNGQYTQHSLTNMIKMYHEQVERGLIVDSPFENEHFPFTEVEDIEVSDKDIKEGGIYG